MITVNKISGLLSASVEGDGEVTVCGMASARTASVGDLTFAMDPEQLEEAKNSPAACVMTTLEVSDYPKPVLKVRDIKESLTVLYNAMLKLRPPGESEIHPSSIVSKSASIGDSVKIEANCVISDNVRIGDNVHVYPNVTLYSNAIIGSNVIIHSGAVIGADGFGYITKDGDIYKVPQMGSVIIEDNVEIGSNTCVDRGTFTDTVIGENTKIDNLVQIAHNVKIGKNVFIAAQVGIAGSAVIGDNVMMGGQAGVKDHSIIGNNVKFGARAGVVKNKVKDGSVLFGYPAKDADIAMKEIAFLSLLTKKRDRIIKILNKEINGGEG